MNRFGISLRLLALFVGAALAFVAAPASAAATPQDARSVARGVLDRPGADGVSRLIRGPGSRESFYELLHTPLFLSGTVGPFDVFVMQADGFETEHRAGKALGKALDGLKKLVPVMERYFPPRSTGLIGGRRFPIVLTHASSDESSYSEMVALLDWAEQNWTGWTTSGNNPLFDPSVLRAVTARTWEAQVFNLGHAEATTQADDFYEHGLGYYTLAHVVSSVLNRGAWGLVPPFVAQGLIDELDIEAYGEAWVGGDWWLAQTPGWFRPGWSGFVPQGSSPPAPVTGPPADLAVTVSESGDSWQHRKRSEQRHWSDLVADRESESPASFAFMAEHESFLPRDRALARCFMHLLLEVAPAEDGPSLFELVDREPERPLNGMPSSEPLPVVFARALGGVPAVTNLEAQSLGRLLQVLGQDRIARELEELGAAEVLELSDHRDQTQWLYEQDPEVVGMDQRVAIWNLLLTAEYYQQLHAWKLLGEAFDERIDAALAASKKFPTRGKALVQVRDAFRNPPRS
ncbi:MAG: hypothetical protein DHS20C15_33810 [Planctomycetota bacterium]|nr:MAG: hypothetical protein DHS20C15_33810 [Planctomycetota bacterium]